MNVSMVRVWDLPTRLFHGVLALTVIAAVLTGLNGEMTWHVRLGEAALALVLFRLGWGLWGGYWSRWSRLNLLPSAVMAYARAPNEPRWAVGHSPLGAWSVLTLLLMLLVQVVSGMMSSDEVATYGPLYAWVSEAQSRWASVWHQAAGAWGFALWLVGHLAALMLYARRGRNLVPAMWHGNAMAPEPLKPVNSQDSGRSRLWALGWAVVCMLMVVALVDLAERGPAAWGH